MPKTLFGRLVVILVSGMLAAQVLTSSIWFDMRHSQVLEIPTRLIAARLANIQLRAQHDIGQAEQLIALLDSPKFHLALHDQRPSGNALPSPDAATEQLLRKVITQKSGYSGQLHLTHLALVDSQGGASGFSALLAAEPVAGHFQIELQLPDGRWLSVDAIEDQGWTSQAPLDLLLDYVLRIYLLRIIVVVLIALLAVRLAIRPLNQLAKAAQELGGNIHRAPLALSGPSEVRRAAEAFNAMQQRLIANLAERTRLLAAISHDLRSPITRLRLRAEKVEAPALRQQLRDDLEDMEQMVSSTLEFVSGAHVSEVRQALDVNALLFSLQADFEDVGQRVAINGRAEQPIQVFARSLKRCVHNLVENGVRYGERVQITVQDSDSLLRLVIRDHGPGIPEALLEQVIEPFYRLEASRNRDTGGYGLGLSIAHAVAAAHGGRLILGNADDGGLEAILELPRD